eukprot:CAMPEP_0116901614 /NCGR_PEP_ID=MMETSP0467-20121206/9475_1 /TAXON_ID=283647 /ORGANISM="Mesodinium pulex, Strain SPMC105" /LENGTH=72 /DNA_ID=CAMNT_0004575195 /DNA_START=474 /DNA_END=688 /DNA_ORIENTATION=+
MGFYISWQVTVIEKGVQAINDDAIIQGKMKLPKDTMISKIWIDNDFVYVQLNQKRLIVLDSELTFLYSLKET